MAKATPKEGPKPKAEVKGNQTAPRLLNSEGKPKSPRPKPLKQQDLPTMENRDIPEIEAAADAYVQARDERCALSKIESEKKALLIGILKKHQRSFYSYNGLQVTLSSVDNVKVKTEKTNEEDED